MNAMKDKMCPFFKENCKEEKCGVYNEIIDNCGINVLSYNMYKLSVVEKERTKAINQQFHRVKARGYSG